MFKNNTQDIQRYYAERKEGNAISLKRQFEVAVEQFGSLVEQFECIFSEQIQHIIE